jgi:hypothetical protein
MRLFRILALAVVSGCASTPGDAEDPHRTTRDGHASFDLPEDWQPTGKGADGQQWQLKRGEAVVASLEVIFIPLYADFVRRPHDLAAMVGKDDPVREYEIVAAGETEGHGAPAVTVRYRMGHGATYISGTNLFILTAEGAVEFKVVYWMGEPEPDVEREAEGILASARVIEAQ